jgi:hypothetical protein
MRTTVLNTRLAEEESDDEKWTAAILVPLGCRRMRVNSRRLQPFGEILSVVDAPKPRRAESRLRSHRMVSSILILCSVHYLNIYDTVYIKSLIRYFLWEHPLSMSSGSGKGCW